MAEETGRLLNGAINDGVGAGLGIGQAVTRFLASKEPQFARASVLAVLMNAHVTPRSAFRSVIQATRAGLPKPNNRYAGPQRKRSMSASRPPRDSRNTNFGEWSSTALPEWKNNAVDAPAAPR